MEPMEQIYQQYAAMVYRYLLGLTRDADLAEELTQETFYQAIRTSERYDGTSKVSTWLCGIARNVLQTHRRKNPAAEDWDAQTSRMRSARPTGSTFCAGCTRSPSPGARCCISAFSADSASGRSEVSSAKRKTGRA